MDINNASPIFPFQSIWCGKNWDIVARDSQCRYCSSVWLPNISLVKFLPAPDKKVVTGLEKVGRLKNMSPLPTRLDHRVLYQFWSHKNLIPEIWKTTINESTIRIHFDGTEFVTPWNVHCTLYMYWSNQAQDWHVTYRRLEDELDTYDRSALILAGSQPMYSVITHHGSQNCIYM